MLSKEIKNFINTNRRDFTNQPFSEEMAFDNPIKQYEKWFEEAINSAADSVERILKRHKEKQRLLG